MSKAKLMLGNAVEICLIFRRILGPLVWGWAPNHFVLGAQLAPGEKRLVCIPVNELRKYCRRGAFCNNFDLHEAIIDLENQFSVFLTVAVLHRFYCTA